jgi:hypothetical protein
MDLQLPVLTLALADFVDHGVGHDGRRRPPLHEAAHSQAAINRVPLEDDLEQIAVEERQENKGCFLNANKTTTLSKWRLQDARAKCASRVLMATVRSNPIAS